MQSYGGVSRYYSIVADQLLRKSEDVRIFAGIHKNSYLTNLPDGVVKGKKVSKYPIKTDRVFHLINYGISQMSMKAWRPDIVHETYYSALPTCNMQSIRVTSVHDMIHELFSTQFSKYDTTTQRKMKAFDRVDHIISVSQNTKKDLIKLFNIDESKISVVHLGVDQELFGTNNINSQFKDQSYILFVGSRDGYKNFIGFLKACAASKVIKNQIIIIAFGGGQFSQYEESIIASLGFLDGYVVQMNGNDEILASLYASAICLVFPSLYEGFGLPPLEAMAAKCPVVCSNTSSMPEVINDAGIYFNPNSLEEMRSAIESIITDEELRDNIITLGLQNIKNFSWQKCADETLDIYQKVTGKT